MKINSNTVFITGGTSGIGLGFAKEFARQGNTVIICGRSEDRLNNIKGEFPQIITRQCDVSIAEEREALYAWVKENYPAVNVLINNAGVQLNNQINAAIDNTRLEYEIHTNVIAPVHLSGMFIDLLMTKHEAAIINISSGLAFVPLAHLPIYCATKAAIHSISLSLRHQLKDTSIKVFEIAPPMVDTNLGQDRRDDKTQSHGGISVTEFINETMPAIAADVFEVAIGQAKGLYEKREAVFGFMNK